MKALSQQDFNRAAWKCLFSGVSAITASSRVRYGSARAVLPWGLGISGQDAWLWATRGWFMPDRSAANFLGMSGQDAAKIGELGKTLLSPLKAGAKFRQDGDNRYEFLFRAFAHAEMREIFSPRVMNYWEVQFKHHSHLFSVNHGETQCGLSLFVEVLPTGYYVQFVEQGTLLASSSGLVEMQGDWTLAVEMGSFKPFSESIYILLPPLRSVFSMEQGWGFTFSSKISWVLAMSLISIFKRQR